MCRGEHEAAPGHRPSAEAPGSVLSARWAGLPANVGEPRFLLVEVPPYSKEVAKESASALATEGFCAGSWLGPLET